MKYLIITLLLFTSLTTLAQTSCDHFKVGRFKYADAGKKDVTIIRTATTQTETDDKTGAEVSGAIEWITDCEYTLTFKKVTVKGMEKLLNQKITTKITAFDGERYTCTATLDGKKFDMEIIKVTDQ